MNNKTVLRIKSIHSLNSLPNNIDYSEECINDILIKYLIKNKELLNTWGFKLVILDNQLQIKFRKKIEKIEKVIGIRNIKKVKRVNKLNKVKETRKINPIKEKRKILKLNKRYQKFCIEKLTYFINGLNVSAG